ncbi:MAG: hypothetical protein KME32_13295 [Mojavia pulchra JT2-VF2]|uniref:Uncharacterized protein n=1 Tax=Mojavia pulchra JT2-VF2 TaxID=287848 RepID=A0A951PXD8_9NOST|nr:hypothetical protein [Mojavia pulchra JT2-VF2]
MLIYLARTATLREATTLRMNSTITQLIFLNKELQPQGDGVLVHGEKSPMTPVRSSRKTRPRD